MSSTAAGKQKAFNHSSAPAPEIIQDWGDGEGGFTFERGRMESSVRELCFTKPISAIPSINKDETKNETKSNFKPKKDEVDYLVKNLMITRSVAEQALIANSGDMTQTLIQLMSPPITTPAAASTPPAAK